MKPLEENKEFRGMISDIKMPTMRRSALKLHGFGEYVQQELHLNKELSIFSQALYLYDTFTMIQPSPIKFGKL